MSDQTRHDGPETLEEGTRKGYLGTTPDDTPNEAYTVDGVTSSNRAAEADRNPDRPTEADAQPKRSRSR